MMCYIDTGRLVVTFVLILFMTGCARTPPITYYQVSALDTEEAEVAGRTIGDAFIGIGPVRLAEFLDRPQIVVRQNPNLLHVADGHRWVEPLTENISRVLRENISLLLKTENFLFYPWSRTAPVDYQVMVEVLRFEGEGYDAARLAAVWSIRDKEGSALVPDRRDTYRVATTSPDHQGLVSALSEALSILCVDIAGELMSLNEVAGH